MIDTHAHLNEIEDVHRAILRAKDAGIKGIVAVGMDLLSNQRTLDLASQFPEMVHPAIGYHPWSISQDTMDENIQFIEKNLGSCIALGEVGIDYKTKVKKPLQWEIFSRISSGPLYQWNTAFSIPPSFTIWCDLLWEKREWTITGRLYLNAMESSFEKISH